MPDLRRLPLPLDGWTVRAVGGEGSPLIGARGIEVGPFLQASIHALLAHAGVSSPWRGERAELDSEWVGRTEWSFAREIDVPAVAEGRHCALFIEVIDGPCEVILGGRSLGLHRSEHVPFEASVPTEMRGRRVSLELRLKAPVSEVLRWQSELGERPVNGDWTPFCFARSAA
jgi:beta-galactosidase/beta-glucuronidase